MDLKDFVSESLRQIIDGVKEAQEHAGRTGAVVVPLFSSPDPSGPSNSIVLMGGGRGTVGRHWYHTIEYDVALAASENVQTKTGGGVLMVVSAGGSRETTTSQENTSRIKFSIPLVLPHQMGAGKASTPPTGAATPVKG